MDAGLDPGLASKLLRDPSPDVRELLVGHLPAGHVDLKALAAEDPSPLVRASALRRLADPSAKSTLLKAARVG